MVKMATTKVTEKRYTNIRLSPDTRKLVRVAATLCNEEYFYFIETAILERFVRLTKGKNLPIDLNKVPEEIKAKIAGIEL